MPEKFKLKKIVPEKLEIITYHFSSFLFINIKEMSSYGNCIIFTV